MTRGILGTGKNMYASELRVDAFGRALQADEQSSLLCTRFHLVAEVPTQPTELRYRGIRDEGAAAAMSGLVGEMLEKIGISSKSGIGPGRVVAIAPPGVDLETKGIVGIYQGKTSEYVEVLAFSKWTGVLEACRVPFAYGVMQTVWDLRELDGLVRALHQLNLTLRPEWLSHASMETLELFTKSIFFGRRMYALQRLGRYDELIAVVIKEFTGGVAEHNSDDAVEMAKYADETLSQMLLDHPEVSERIRVLLRVRLDPSVVSGG